MAKKPKANFDPAVFESLASRRNAGGAIGGSTSRDSLIKVSPMLILAGSAAIILLFFGFTITFAILDILKSPILGNSIPVWAVVALILAFIWIRRRG